MSEITKAFVSGFVKFDFVIWIMAIANAIIYMSCLKATNKIYYTYNSSDQLSNLDDDQKDTIERNTTQDKMLGKRELLALNTKMLSRYSWFANISTAFPLMGMLGTVWALLGMVGNSADVSSTSFMGALTSTFWGIIFAVICKGFDAFISYRIESNEKQINRIIYPGKGSMQ